MGKLVPLLRGVWLKANTGEWDFHYDPSDIGFRAMIRDQETFDSLIGIVRTRYLLEDTTPVALTYQFPNWMLVPCGERTPPENILSDADVLQFMSVRIGYPELTIFVTVGSEAVATYQFQCRATFMVGGSSNLGGDIHSELGDEIPGYHSMLS